MDRSYRKIKETGNRSSYPLTVNCLNRFPAESDLNLDKNAFPEVQEGVWSFHLTRKSVCLARHQRNDLTDVDRQ